MPPHCDTMDGPVVSAAKRALEKGNVNHVAAAREYVQAMLGFVLYSHHLYSYVKGGDEPGETEGGHKH